MRKGHKVKIADNVDPVTVTVKGAVKMTGLGESTVWAYIADGSLKSTNVGRRRLVFVSSIESLLGIDQSAA